MNLMVKSEMNIQMVSILERLEVDDKGTEHTLRRKLGVGTHASS
jgi:hypothetical protein